MLGVAHPAVQRRVFNGFLMEAGFKRASDCFLLLSLSALVTPVFQDIPGLTIERFTDCLQRRETNGFGFVIFQNRKIGHRDADLRCKFGDTHFPFCQHHIDIDEYCHNCTPGLKAASFAHTVKSFSDLMSTALWRSFWKTAAAVAMTTATKAESIPIATAPAGSSPPLLNRM
jgi:hypothetical protein